MNYTDRSRSETFQRCPAKRFWGYGFEGRGIQANEPKAEKELGQALHIGIARLMKGYDIKSALFSSKRYLTKHLPGVDGIQAKLTCEGLLRAFDKIWLPKIFNRYMIVNVESEETFNLSDDLIFMSRPDAILEHKISGDLYLWSLKSTRKWDDRRAKEHLHDTQGVSEIPGVEVRLGRKIKGVHVFFMLTGRKIEGYPFSFYNRFTSVTVENPQKIVESLSISELEAFFHPEPVYFRNREELEEWQTETAEQECRIKVEQTISNGGQINVHWNSLFRKSLFPKHRHACHELGRCEFYKLCWENGDPSRGFSPREFNHPIEGKNFLKEKK